MTNESEDDDPEQDRPGWAPCHIYRISEDQNGHPKLEQAGRSEKIYNLSKVRIDQRWFVVHKTKGSKWVASAMSNARIFAGYVNRDWDGLSKEYIWVRPSQSDPETGSYAEFRVYPEALASEANFNDFKLAKDTPILYYWDATNDHYAAILVGTTYNVLRNIEYENVGKQIKAWKWYQTIWVWATIGEPVKDNVFTDLSNLAYNDTDVTQDISNLQGDLSSLESRVSNLEQRGE
jgi:hypothetical protein